MGKTNDKMTPGEKLLSKVMRNADTHSQAPINGIHDFTRFNVDTRVYLRGCGLTEEQIDFAQKLNVLGYPRSGERVTVEKFHGSTLTTHTPASRE